MQLKQFLENEGWGAGRRLAKQIQAPPPDVYSWASGAKPCPPKRCVAIEKATGGKVSRVDLRPDDYLEHWPELAS